MNMNMEKRAAYVKSQKRKHVCYSGFSPSGFGSLVYYVSCEKVVYTMPSLVCLLMEEHP